MSVSRTGIEYLFEVGSAITRDHNEGALVITAILDDHLLLQAPDKPACNPESPLACLAAEYRKRAEQARLDAEVDAMWRTAIVCQL